MANEITVTMGISAAKANAATVNRTSSNTTHNFTGAKVRRLTQAVPTTAAGTAIDVSDLSTQGWAYFENLDSSNFVEVGVQVSGTFYPFAKLLSGERALLPLGTSAPFARGDTASVNLDVEVMER